MFYTRFIELCAKAGKKPTPVVLELGLSKMSCTNWKKGHMPSDVTIKKIADYFGVSVEYLKDEEQKNIPSNQQVPTTGDEDFKKLYAILSTENQAAVRSHMIELLKEQMQG